MFWGFHDLNAFSVVLKKTENHILKFSNFKIELDHHET